MIINHATSRDIGQRFAEVIRQHPVRALRVRALPAVVELWLVTEPISLEVEREIHGASGMLHERFPDVAYALHIINPRNYPEVADVLALVPRESEPVTLWSLEQ